MDGCGGGEGGAGVEEGLMWRRVGIGGMCFKVEGERAGAGGAYGAEDDEEEGGLCGNVAARKEGSGGVFDIWKGIYKEGFERIWDCEGVELLC